MIATPRAYPRRLVRRRTRAIAASVAASVAAVGLAMGASVSLAQVLAFPEAEGFGRFATGGRTNLSSATVYHVTNLNDSGAGSLRDALSQSNRFVVFDVGGIINLSSVVTVASNITIAGQTAPGGIGVYNNRVAFHGANNLISRYWGIRLGTSQGREDAASLVRGTNMMWDHMSITWGVDGTFDINPDTGQTIDNLTIQNSIIGQGLDVVGHSTGGLMTIGEGNRFSVIKSLFADNVTRNPKARGENEFINNVVYGYETSGYIMGDTTATSHANAEGNYFIEGPVDGSSPFASGTSSFHIYANDNWVDGNRDGVLNGSLNTTYPGADVLATRNAFPTTASMTAQQAVQFVMTNVGSNITRDAVDTRLVQEVASYGTLGGVIVRDSDLFPGYGTSSAYLNPRARLTDADNDGIPDNWETAHGLSPTNATDWKGLNAAGYTRLEEYLNELGGYNATKNAVAGGGAWTTPATWVGGAVPTFSDTAVSTGALTHASGNAFARRLIVSGGGGLTVTGGTLDVFDTALVSGPVAISGGTVTFGQLQLGAPGQSGSLSLSSGATLQGGPITTGGGTGTFDWNGGTFRATGAPNVTVPTTLGAFGGILDTNGFSGTYSGQITGAGGLIKTGAGTLTVTGNNSYSGGTTLTGNLKLAHNNAAGTGSITVTSTGGTVQLANGVTVSNNIVTNYTFECLDVPDPGAAAYYAGNLTRAGSSQVRMQASGSGAWLNITGAVTAPNGFYFKTGQLNLRGNGSITGGGGAAIGRGGSLATTFLIRDSASFNVGAFSMGGGQALPSASIQVIQNATLSTGAANLDLLNTTTTTSNSQLHLDGGTTIVGGFTKTSTGATQVSTIGFNGGTLRYGGSGTNASFLPALVGLTANVQTGGARIDTNGGAITIAQPLVHDAALGATPDGGLTKSGAGTLTLASAANTYTGGTSVTGGTLVLTNTGTFGSGGISVSNGATLDIAAGRSAALKMPSLNVTTNGSVDVRDNDLIVGSATPKSAIETLVSAARNGGTWDAPGITSSDARNNANHTTGLGVLSGAEYTSLGNSSFDGIAVQPTDTLVKYTWNGDANLDGRVTFDDYVKIDTGFNSQLTGWLNGDFNYSGAVNFDDYVLIDIAFNSQNGTLARAVDWISGDDRTESGSGVTSTGVAQVIEHFERFGSAYGAAFLAAVPEPSAGASVAAGAVLAFAPRRRRWSRAVSVAR